MPKSYGELFEKFTSWENLITAYTGARKHKKRSCAAMNLHERYERYLCDLRDSLISSAWKPLPYKSFTVYNETKKRDIQAPAFRDRVVQHAIVQILEPIYEKKFIYDSYACRKGKGTHRAADRVQEFLRYATAKLDRECYVLKCDISKFFPSIRHDILFDIIARSVREERFMDIVRRAVVATGNQSGVGLPIGALTSQLCSNIYLDQLDHFMKECVGAQYYARYADDFFVIDNDTDKLRLILNDIRWFLDTQLRLKLNPKMAIFNASQGVDFCGYRIWATHRLPRKRVVKNARKRMKGLMRKFKLGEVSACEVRQSAASFVGYMRHCGGERVMKSVFMDAGLKMRGARGVEIFDEMRKAV